MSTLELPPINSKLPPASASKKESLNQVTTSSKNFHFRFKNGTKMPRNHSDSSLSGMMKTSPCHQSLSCTSLNSYPNGNHTTSGYRSRDQSTSPCPNKMSSSLSWCATENSAGSVPKLETVFEQKLLNTSENKNLVASDVPITSLNMDHKTNPTRSLSVIGMHQTGSQDMAKLQKAKQKRLQSECDVDIIDTKKAFDHFGRLKSNGMRRTVSDNKLVDKKNIRNAQLNNIASSNNSNNNRILSVNRTEVLTNTKTKLGFQTNTNFNPLRRAQSVLALNGSYNHVTSRKDSGFVHADGFEVGGSEDSEEDEEKKMRIRDWLLGLDFADDPPEPEIDYADDSPQTDTAFHIVYDGD